MKQIKKIMNNNSYNLHYISLYNVPIGMLGDIQKEIEPYVGQIFAIQLYDVGDYSYLALTASEQLNKSFVNVKITVELQDIIQVEVMLEYLRKLVDEQREKVVKLNELFIGTNNG